MRRRKREAVRVRRGSHSMWECCAACGGIALKCRTITHEDVARSGISFFCLRVCCRGCGCVCVGRVGPMAAACGCHSVLLENMLRHFHVCVASGTVCWRLCGCRMEGEEWRELRERRGQQSRWASRRRGDCPPSPAPPCRASSITPQHLSRRHQHAARQRMPPPPRVRPEGTLQLLPSEGAIRVAQRRAHNLIADSAHKTPGTGRGVFASWRTLRLLPSSFQVDGRLFLLFFPPRRVAAQ
ncbi:hypothetical protein Tc00.1047053504899.30 [Trypanosoma cruzi]|uniref:Uncharacterized protein n=1 Tax=Trypanosoma cruzi (strain CL Brener) TaxID=353153 RepID=Q4CSH2_TRYCC|nr:uncharacterized protein Tc00.1047053504899.30 [Trypanosoma cruzi]EAN83224.1 hypothetical protein Tc00.1047053504899.30 [Trypanosoma cruzi]|eukprot:XP_805075.1 hypothetical protein Tc00.1047053504899.30 [Trypanosoma cruzi strain CL Brener]